MSRRPIEASGPEGGRFKMKKILFGFLILAMAMLAAFTIVSWAEEEKKEEKTPKSICPKTQMSADCLSCHTVPDFKLKECKPDAHLDYPDGVKIRNEMGYFTITEIRNETSDKVRDFFEYLKLHKIKHAILDIHSPGGSLFGAWRIKGLINEFQDAGGIVETRVRGFAASAGSIIFIAGSKGHRVANPQAEFMFHELGIFKGGIFYIEMVTPSSAEDEAKTLRHLQETITSWLATRGKMSKADLDEKVRKKEFWFSGKEARDFGFVDRLVIGD